MEVLEIKGVEENLTLIVIMFIYVQTFVESEKFKCKTKKLIVSRAPANFFKKRVREKRRKTAGKHAKFF
ncbi:hypothetical protein B9Q11_02345 [Candidatus Marsarchaeota G2 archaeon ECH_B_SAG-F08]|uniref:Uncharacterized protein n=1 Tax=Candidatus Marsarchaeota G2 archaeon ECH_B_SAG-F08 TaxID=1978165 RepID=A0A2R6BIT3_9ARCH|nr:MAG: hypothetical protein B9Q11_02345 [Candidatus Marsarchaeota G2 archaeon ECH_B_SAG-F08]